MIRKLLKLIVVNAFGIFIASLLNSELFLFTGDYRAYLMTGLVIVLVNLLVRPLINLLLLPVHLITLGMFRWITNLILLYIIARIAPDFAIGSFVSSKINLGFIIIPPVYFSSLGSYILASLILSLVFQFLYWLFEV